MPKVACLYIDDSGTRNPNHNPSQGQYRDWFALGGVLIDEEREDEVRDAHAKFCGDWGITYPLHSVDIRCRNSGFSWLRTLPSDERQRFMEELSELILGIPVIGHACVIDRPGYDGRYREKYGRQQWMLCKTAFSVLCERAAKLARSGGRKLRVYPEAGDPTADSALRSYYAELRANGMPFGGPDASKYAALTADELRETLYDLKFKNKSSAMAQLADLYLYPMARGGYEPHYRPYEMLVARKKIIDAIISEEDQPHLGIKYYCFESVVQTSG